MSDHLFRNTVHNGFRTFLTTIIVLNKITLFKPDFRSRENNVHMRVCSMPLMTPSVGLFHVCIVIDSSSPVGAKDGSTVVKDLSP